MNLFQMLAKDFPDQIIGYKGWFVQQFGKTVYDEHFLNGHSFADSSPIFQEGAFRAYLIFRGINIAETKLLPNKVVRFIIISNFDGGRKHELVFEEPAVNYMAVVEKTIYRGVQVLFGIETRPSIKFTQGSKVLLTVSGTDLNMKFEVEKLKTDDEYIEYGKNLGHAIAAHLILQKNANKGGANPRLN